jgi:uncharacterized protein YycO
VEKGKMNHTKVALFSGKVSAISKLIEWETRSIYCHAALLLRDGSLVESIEPNGVRRVNPYVPDPEEPAQFFTVPGMDDDKAETFALEQIGEPYAMINLVGFLTRSGVDEDRGKWFCSELVFAAVQAGGVSLLRNVPAFMVSPGMLGLSPLLYLTLQIAT